MNIKLSVISENRTDLMGIAMLGVLIGHLVNLGGLNQSSFFVRGISIIPKIAFTQTFLFLSGLGIYNSLMKTSSLRQYYKKRLVRVFLPAVLILVPFNSVFLFHGQITVTEFISKSLFFSYWINGNDNGMWYISVALFLYAIAPLLIAFKSGKYVGWGGHF